MLGRIGCLLVLPLVGVAAGCGSSSYVRLSPTTSSTTESSAPQNCVLVQQAGILADFGHRRSMAAAQRLMATAEKFGFKDLQIEQRGCDDYAVVLAGVRSMRQGAALRREARSVGLSVALDCRSQPSRQSVAALFGRARTRRSALRLAMRARRQGFKGLQVIQTACSEWDAILYGLTTPSEQGALKQEARKSSLKVTFVPG